MSWGLDVYLELVEQGLIQRRERGALPLPEDVAAAMEADGKVAIADAVRNGTVDGRAAFRDALLAIVAIKRGTVEADGWLRQLPVDVLAPFETTRREPCGDHTRRLADLRETREHVDAELRR